MTLINTTERAPLHKPTIWYTTSYIFNVLTTYFIFDMNHNDFLYLIVLILIKSIWLFTGKHTEFTNESTELLCNIVTHIFTDNKVLTIVFFLGTLMHCDFHQKQSWVDLIGLKNLAKFRLFKSIYLFSIGACKKKKTLNKKTWIQWFWFLYHANLEQVTYSTRNIMQ